MINTYSVCSGLLLLGMASLAPHEATGQVASQNGALEVIAINGAGAERHLSSIDGVVPMVMVRPNQVVPITLQFPTDKAGTPVAATPLDGGKVAGKTPAVLPTGRFVFTFSPGALPGRYRLIVQTPLEEHLLKFYVVDPKNPASRSRTR